MKVCIDSVIDSAKFRLGLRDTSMADLDLERLINEGAMHLDAIETYVISCETLEVECSKAKLPDGFLELICIQPEGDGCNGSCGCNYNFNPVTDQNPTDIICNCTNYYAIDRNVLTEFCGMGYNCGGNSNVFDIQNGYLVFSSNFTPTSVKIWFRSYNMDENGLMVLDEYWQRGLSAYAAYQYAMSGQNFKLYPQAAQWQREWTAQLNKIRGKSAQRDHRQHKGLFSAIARAILINPVSVLNHNL
jgi:hypothetical protein